MTLAPQDGTQLPEAAAPPSLLTRMMGGANPLALLQLEHKKKAWANWASTEFNRMRQIRRPIERQWYINYAFYMGKQNIAVVNSSANDLGFQLITPKVPPWRVRMVTNKIRVMVRTEISKLTSNRPIPIVVPATTEDEDYAAARAGEQILKSEFTRSEFDQVVRSWVWWGSVTGSAFMKSYWDPSQEYSSTLVPDMTQPPGPDGQPQMKEEPQYGCIKVERISPFHIFIPDLLEEDLQKQPYVCHAMTKDPLWVKRTYGINVNPTTTSTHDILEQSFLNLMGHADQKKDSVLVLEYWIKPGGHPDFPQGGLLTVVDDTVVQHIGFDDGKGIPVPHKEYPFYKYTGIPTGQFYGESMIVDLISLQKEYNRTSSQIIEAKNMAAKPKLLAPLGSINPKQITTEPGQAILYTQGYERPSQLDLPQLPQYVLEELNRLQNDMDDISGQHEITRGNTPSQVTAATAISYLQEQDDSKLAYQIAGVEHAISKLGTHYLKMVARYWDTPRLVRTVGRDGLFEAQMWQGNDLRGNTDVQVLAGSALPHSRAAKQAFVMDLMKLGLVPPEQGLEMLDIGNMEKILEDYLIDKRQAQRENLKMAQADPQALEEYFNNPQVDPMSGQPMPPQPPLPPNSYDNHQVHIHLHNQFRKSQAFEILPEPLKIAFELHVQAHQAALMYNSQYIDSSGNSGHEVPPDGNVEGQEQSEEEGQPPGPPPAEETEPTQEGA